MVQSRKVWEGKFSQDDVAAMLQKALVERLMADQSVTQEEAKALLETEGRYFLADKTDAQGIVLFLSPVPMTDTTPTTNTSP